MGTRYQDYLAAQILSEGRIITYRSLSRALKVHNNAAKEMLFEFHRSQNARRPSSLHATYLISGYRKLDIASQANGTHSQDGEDSLMGGRSFISSSMPEQEMEGEKIRVTSITLTGEEDLEVVKQRYETISSIHVYSLEPGLLNNIQILSDCNRKIAADYHNEDLLETWKQYGTIHNPAAKRRTNARPPPTTTTTKAPVAAAVKVTPKPPVIITSAKSSDNVPANRRGSTPETKKEEQTTKKTTGKPPTLKRNSSSIFKSFAKTKAPAKTDATAADASNAPSPAPSGGDSQLEDVAMQDGHASDDDFEFDAELPDNVNSAEAAQKAEAARKVKAEREAALRKMMEDDGDEPMDDAPAAEEGSTTHSPPLEPTSDGQSLKPQAIPSPSEQGQEPEVTVSNGRRRGRRKVMKKKTTRDAEGYLVTREEAAWESFSEDEPVPQSQQQQAGAKKLKGSGFGQVEKGASGAGTSSVDKGVKDKGGKKGKPGQGNIMNFFAKK